MIQIRSKLTVENTESLELLNDGRNARQDNYNPGIRTQGNFAVSIVLIFMARKGMDLDGYNLS